MRYLSLALYAEGPNDYHFLRPLLQRLCEELCAKEARSTIDISEVLPLDDPEGLRDLSREDRIFAAAQAAQDAWNVLFIHADSDGDVHRARRERVSPAIHKVSALQGKNSAAVAVVPVRETEAWAIADGDALRRVFGTNLADGELGLPIYGHQIEASADPKKILNQAFIATRPSNRHRRRGPSPYLNALGESVSFEKLRKLDAFGALEEELRGALRRMHIL